MSPRPRSVRLGAELLESRVVPAGNVTVAVQGGLVSVLGDADANAVEISTGSGGAVAFRGLNGTRVNGSGDQLVVPGNGGLAGLSVSLGGGDDHVIISSRSEADPRWPYPPGISALQVAQAVNIDGGEGHDVTQLRNVTVGADLNVIGAQGDDITVLESVNVAGNFAIKSGPGANSVLVRASTVTGTSTIRAGSSADVAGLIGSTFTGASDVTLRGGDNQLTAETNTFQAAFSLPQEGTGTDEMTEGVEGLNTFGGAFLRDGWAETLHTVATTHFEYEGEDGPDHWGSLSPAWLLTNEGRQQTPVAINTATAVRASLPALNFAYGDNTNLNFVHNGHAIQVNFPTPATNTLTVSGNTYKLLQFHFHTESEHTIDGESFPLELHLVHADAAGNLMVATVFIEEGAANPAFDQLIANLPSLTNTPTTVAGPFNPEGLLPTDRSIYAYSGSLTTPPGSEGVSFAMFKTAVELSASQIQAIETALGLENNRPVQPLNNRVIFSST